MNSPILCGEIQPNRLSQDPMVSIETFIFSTEGDIPRARSGHIGCLIESQDSIFIQGGYDKREDHSDCFILNIRERRWIHVNTALAKEDSLRFTGHACLNLPFEHCSNNVMLFGGWDGGKYTNQVTVVNIQNRQVRQSLFTEQATKSDALNTQKNAKSTLDAKLLLKTESQQKITPVHSQFAPAQQSTTATSTHGSNTTTTFSTTAATTTTATASNTSIQPSIPTDPTEIFNSVSSQATPKLIHNIQSKKSISKKYFPPGVRDHSLVYDCVRNAVLLFGGWDSTKFEFGSNEYNSLWLLDSKWDWHNVKTAGDIPQGRRGHSCVFLQSPYGLLVFGGIHGYNKIVNQCFFLDLKTFIWTLILPKPNSYYPQPTAFHSATLVSDKVIYYGGLIKPNRISNQIFIHNISLDVWSEVDNSKSIIPPLMMHTSILVDSDEIYIFGGVTEDLEAQNKQKTIGLENIFVLHLESKEFDLSTFTQILPLSPKRHQKEEQLQWNMMAFPALEVRPEKEENELVTGENEEPEIIHSKSEQLPPPFSILALNELDSLQSASESSTTSPKIQATLPQFTDRMKQMASFSQQPTTSSLLQQTNQQLGHPSQLVEQKYISKSLKRKMPYQLSQVIEENAKVVQKTTRQSESIQITMNRNRKNLEEDEDDEYDEIDEQEFKLPNNFKSSNPIKLPAQDLSYDPFENFPESETN